MGDKVVHLNQNIHAKAKEFCRVRGIQMKDWVESLIYKAIEDPPPPKNAVTKRPLTRMIDGKIDPENPPESLPPFWENRDAGN